MRVAHRPVGHAVVRRFDGIAEHAVGDATERIGTAEAFFGGVEPAVPVVVGGAEQTVEHLLEVVAQLRAVLLVTLAQHLLGEATELERVVIGEGHAHAQRLAKGATAQGRYGGGQRMHRRATVDTNGLPPVAQLTGVAGRAGHIQIGATGLIILVAGKADRQVAGVQRGGLLRGIDQKAEAGKVVGRGELFPAEGQFQRTEPVVLQPLNLSALRRVVVGLSLRGVPLLQIMQRFGRFVLWKVREGHEIQPDPHGQHSQQQDSPQGSAQQSHRYILVASWRVRVYGRVVG